MDTSSNDKATPAVGLKLWASAAVVVMVLMASAFDSSPETYSESKIRSVMIDAGHGGHDGGNQGTGRYSENEKEIALEVALKVGKYIEDNLSDVEVLYTRQDDRFHELHDRTKMANRAGVDLFISVHCDAFTKETAHGCGSYVMGVAKTSANMRTAQKENAAMLKEKDYEKNYGGFDPYSPESYIELSLRQNAFLDQSLDFSNRVQKEFRDRVGRTDRGVKQAPFWVISHTTMPSVLIELGFLTNKEEEDFLQSTKGKDYMASAIYRAFKSYKADIEGTAYNELDGLLTPKDKEVFDSTLPPDHEPETEGEATDVAASTRPAQAAVGSEGVVFMVQIASASEPVGLSADNFNGLQGVEQYSADGLYKYTFGRERKYKRAQDLQKKARAAGYDGCFVIAMEGGQRIDLRAAIQKTDK